MADASELDTGTWLERRGAADAMRIRKCRLEVVSGPDAGRELVSSGSTMTIGRGAADLVLTDRKASGLHCELTVERNGYRLRDLGSTNGTYVGTVRIVDAYIPPGTTIRVGKSEVRFTPLVTSVEVALWEETKLDGMVGASPLIRRLFENIVRLAASDATILINGETGTGKELVAEAIHARSPRADGPFVVLDCGSVPARLFDAHIHGHEAGAFTGATHVSQGVFEAAHGGTLFIDEIGELPLDMQPKLLRAVETRTIRRLGGHETIECDVRIVAATNRDLAVETNRGSFRSDLYYRLAVGKLTVPSLRDRLEDVPLLVDHFVAALSGGATKALPPSFLEWAKRQPWPGNVRELRNAVERAIALPNYLPDDDEHRGGGSLPLDVDIDIPFKQAKQQFVDAFDRRYVTQLLERHDWNISAAARAARVDRMSIYKLLHRLGIESPGD